MAKKGPDRWRGRKKARAKSRIKKGAGRSAPVQEALWEHGIENHTVDVAKNREEDGSHRKNEMKYEKVARKRAPTDSDVGDTEEDTRCVGDSGPDAEHHGNPKKEQKKKAPLARESKMGSGKKQKGCNSGCPPARLSAAPWVPEV